MLNISTIKVSVINTVQIGNIFELRNNIPTLTQSYRTRVKQFYRILYVVQSCTVNPRTARGVRICTPLPCVFLNIFATRANFKMRSKLIPRGSNSGCPNVFPVNIALSSTWSELENQGHPPWKNRRFSVGRCNLSLQQHTDIIPTATPTFSTTADLNMKLSTSFDVVDCQFKIAATKPELEITL